ncbi:MAG: heme exporter protein CcmD [bacterium]
MADFFHMGGYGFFVWTSYTVVATLFVFQYFSSRAQHKKLFNQLDQEIHLSAKARKKS